MSYSIGSEPDPFGALVVAVGNSAYDNPFRFSTKYQDDETVLLYYGYRYLSPNSGRWVSRDPIGERGGRNLFSFVSNDPVDWADILGTSPREQSQNIQEPYPPPGSLDGKRVCESEIIVDHLFNVVRDLANDLIHPYLLGIKGDRDPPACGSRIGILSCVPEEPRATLRRYFPAAEIPDLPNPPYELRNRGHYLLRRDVPKYVIESYNKAFHEAVMNQCQECCDLVKISFTCGAELRTWIGEDYSPEKHGSPSGYKKGTHLCDYVRWVQCPPLGQRSRAHTHE